MITRAVIFDLDGTLVDSLNDIGDAMNHALAHFGLATHPLGAYRQFVGEGVEILVQRAVHPRPERTEQVLHEYRRYYAEHSLNRTVPYDGIPELLQELQERGISLAVLSNKPNASTQRIVKQLFGESMFQVVLGERTGVPRKPDPAAALEIARALQASPIETVFVGDSGIDVNTAIAAGMTSIGVLWGLRDRAELVDAGARHLISKPTELLALL